MLSLLVMAAAASSISPCDATSTIDPNACLEARFRDSDAVLNRYYQSALRRVGGEDRGKTREGFIQAEREWVTYRDAECNSLFNFWKGGTIRVSAELDCDIRLTRLRTFVIWRNWLTFPDNTPPLLPRPDLTIGG